MAKILQIYASDESDLIQLPVQFLSHQPFLAIPNCHHCSGLNKINTRRKKKKKRVNCDRKIEECKEKGRGIN